MAEKKLIEIENKDDFSIVTFGSSSLGAVSGIEEISLALREYVDTNKPSRLIIDFNGVRFLSSQMLGLMVDMWRRLGQYNGQMALSGIDPKINRVFKITNLDRLFEFYSTSDQAMEALRKKEFQNEKGGS
jgi:anti-sigma B factor antagonist